MKSEQMGVLGLAAAISFASLASPARAGVDPYTAANIAGALLPRTVIRIGDVRAVALAPYFYRNQLIGYYAESAGSQIKLMDFPGGRAEIKVDFRTALGNGIRRAWFATDSRAYLRKDKPGSKRPGRFEDERLLAIRKFGIDPEDIPEAPQYYPMAHYGDLWFVPLDDLWQITQDSGYMPLYLKTAYDAEGLKESELRWIIGKTGRFKAREGEARVEVYFGRYTNPDGTPKMGFRDPNQWGGINWQAVAAATPGFQLIDVDPPGQPAGPQIQIIQPGGTQQLRPQSSTDVVPGTVLVPTPTATPSTTTPAGEENGPNPLSVPEQPASGGSVQESHDSKEQTAKDFSTSRTKRTLTERWLKVVNNYPVAISVGVQWLRGAEKPIVESPVELQPKLGLELEAPEGATGYRIFIRSAGEAKFIPLPWQPGKFDYPVPPANAKSGQLVNVRPPQTGT